MPPFTIERLPNEILGYIISNLDSSELLPVALVSKRFYLATKDNQLWAFYCKKILEELYYPKDLISIPSDGYVEEYKYQKKLDNYVVSLIRFLSTNSVFKVPVLQKINRLGLRAKKALDEIVNNLDYSQFDIQQRYFAYQTRKSLLYSQTILRLYNMFYENDSLDFFSVYLKLDAFSNDKDAAAHSEEFYATEINFVKTELSGIKRYFESQGGNANEEAVNFTVQQLTDVLDRLNLSHDFSTVDRYIRETRGVKDLLPQSLLFGVFGTYKKTRKFNSPLYMALGAAIYKYFAEWIGLKVTLIPLKFNFYLRVDNPNYSSWTPEDEEYYKGREYPKCIYVDATRSNKVRSHRELEEIARIFKTPMFSFKEIPPSYLSMQVFLKDVSTFMTEICHFVPMRYQFGEEYIGVLFCVYAFGAANRAKRNKANVHFSNIKSTFRVDIELALSHNRDNDGLYRVLESCDKISRLFRSEETEPILQTYIGGPLTYSKLYHTIQGPIKAKPLLFLGVFTEFIIPFAPKSVSKNSKNEMLLFIEKRISTKKSNQRERCTDEEFGLEDQGMIFRNGEQNKNIDGEQIETFDPRKMYIGSAVRLNGVSHGIGIITKVNVYKDRLHENDRSVFYEVLTENGSISVLREENVCNMCTKNDTFHHLLATNKQFFGIDAGMYFKTFDEKHKRFILA